MEAKYRLLGTNHENWSRYIRLRRDYDKENSLFVIQKLSKCESYAVVCKTYATPPETFKAEFNPKTEIRQVEITALDGFTVFDWCGIIEHATEIHFVDTVFTFLAEVLPVRAERLCLYPRSKHETKVITKGLWRKPWEYPND